MKVKKRVPVLPPAPVTRTVGADELAMEDTLRNLQDLFRVCDDDLVRNEKERNLLLFKEAWNEWEEGSGMKLLDVDDEINGTRVNVDIDWYVT